MTGHSRPSMLICSLLVSVCAVPSFAGETVTYNYDPNGRLVKVARSGTINNGATACYAYDKADNRNNVTVATSSDCSPAAGVTFSVGDGAAKEGNSFVFTVTKSGTASGSITLDYATADGGATAGQDYVGNSGTLTFLSTDSSKTVSIATNDDADVENDEQFALNIFNINGGAIAADGQGVGTIQDNDLDCAGVTYSIASNGSVEEGLGAVFTVSKSGTTSSSCSVNYAAADGTLFPPATQPSDYTATSGTLTFASAQSSLTITVPTVEDAVAESTENLNVNLSAPNRGATLGNPSVASAQILDDDTCNTVNFSITNSGPVTEGANAVFTVTKNGTSSYSCSVDYATANGTASAPSDYATTAGTLTFTSSQTTKTVTVGTIDDTAAESAENFSLSLSAPTAGATLGSPSSSTATINDNDSGGLCSGVSYSVNDPAAVVEGSTIVFTVTKTGTTSSSCNLSYASSNGTATAPTYYTAVSGSLTFTSTQTSKTVSITTFDLARMKGTKTMYLNLTSASNGATISDNQGQGRIDPSNSGGCTTCLLRTGTSDSLTEATAPTPDPPE